jgi:hypothetical protein
VWHHTGVATLEYWTLLDLLSAHPPGSPCYYPTQLSQVAACHAQAASAASSCLLYCRAAMQSHPNFQHPTHRLKHPSMGMQGRLLTLPCMQVCQRARCGWTGWCGPPWTWQSQSPPPGQSPLHADMCEQQPLSQSKLETAGPVSLGLSDHQHMCVPDTAPG